MGVMTDIRKPMPDFFLEDFRVLFEEKPRTLIDRERALELIDTAKAEIERLRALAGESDKLTDDQAEGMLKRLSKHYHEPVSPITRYCRTLETWAGCIGERARHLQQELLPQLHEWGNDHKPTPESEAQRDEYERVKAHHALRGLIPRIFAMIPKEAAAEVAKLTLQEKETPRQYRLGDLLDYEQAAHQVERTFLAIHKSNLLARLLYSGEKLRTKMCPEHKGKWSGIEFGDTVCPHKCQLTGWIQEDDDQGKALPGVTGVQMVPTGNAPGEVTMVRSVDGEVLGKAVLQEIPKPPKPDPV